MQRGKRIPDSVVRRELFRWWKKCRYSRTVSAIDRENAACAEAAPLAEQKHGHLGDFSGGAFATLGDHRAMDVGVAQWRTERPDLDSSAKAITGRILRLHDVILRAFNSAFAAHGLKYPNYAVLATLRSAGEPYE